MKLSLNWIKEYLTLPEDLKMTKLSHDLTMSTVEVEDIIDLGAKFSDMVVGRILEIVPHPNADRLRLCKVDIGEDIPVDIVCGGVNITEKMLVVVAKPGALVRWHGQGDPVKITLSKIRGVQSFGMICSSSEIELSELFSSSKEGEIMDLSTLDSTPGTALADALDLNDIILEIDNKSLTNRPDLWSHYGIARELSALYRLPLKPLPSHPLPTSSEGLAVTIEDNLACPRYAALLIKKVSPKASPYWLQTYLWRVGIRPINLLVDITNYVMLAVGQPTHGFDATHVKGGIVVRPARMGEKLTLLNGKELTLTKDDLVIADHYNPLALAGIMGGEKDSILETTDEMILEIANFHAIRTRKTAQRFDLRTESSIRFEKGLDPQRVKEALSLAVEIFRRECPEVEISSFLDNYPHPLPSVTIDLSLKLLERQMGHCIPHEEIHTILNSLGFSVAQKDNILSVTVPSWRSTGDITLPDDLIEEIARLHGYENFETVNPSFLFTSSINQRDFDMERRIREYLAFRCEMQEIFTYPWIHDSLMTAAGVNPNEALHLSTPPAPDESTLRCNLVPNLIGAVIKNLRYFEEFRLFELTQVFFPINENESRSEKNKLPYQPRHLGGVLVGKEPALLFRQGKGVLEHLGRFAQTHSLTFKQVDRPSWADETLWLNVFQEDRNIGILALLSPQTMRSAGIKRASTIIFEIDVEQIQPFPSRENRYERLSDYPQVEFDLSILFENDVKWSDIEESVLKSSQLVKRVLFMDEYRGKQIPDGKKSVMLRLILGDEKGTLTSEQVEAAIAQVSKKLGQKLAGEVRSN